MLRHLRRPLGSWQQMAISSRLSRQSFVRVISELHTSHQTNTKLFLQLTAHV